MPSKQLANLEKIGKLKSEPPAKAEFDGLSHAGTALLVPDAEEHRVLKVGTDPLKVF